MLRYLLPILFAFASCSNCYPAEDALAVVNADRAAKGLKPFIRDAGLTAAAIAACDYREAHRIEGHTGNDFQFLPAGCSADAAGCGAVPPIFGFATCCLNDDYQYAGAAWLRGRDGQNWCHIFCRGGSSSQRIEQPSGRRFFRRR